VVAVGCLALVAPAAATTITVNSTADTDADDGICTLREALDAARLDVPSGAMAGECESDPASADTIEFDSAGSGAPHVIQPGTALPAVGDADPGQGTTIDGLADDPDPIEIDGSTLAGTEAGVTVSSGTHTVRGLSIHGFPGDGIVFLGGGADTIEDNFIGTDSAGTGGIGNGLGIRDTTGAPAVIRGNVISGNAGFGVFLAGSNVAGNTIEGNMIGTNPAGTAALANQAVGIQMFSAGGDHTIGGPSPGDGNVISGNDSYGMSLTGGPSANNSFQGNRIGTNAAGTAAIPNTLGGVFVSDGINQSTFEGNVVSGNDQSGFDIAGGISTPPTDNSLTDNMIGVGGDGTTAIPNGDQGIELRTGATQNTIGGTSPGDGNVIAHNGGDDDGQDEGIVMTGNDTVANPILRNSIHSNGVDVFDIGIDLGADGVTLNDDLAQDADVGPNGLQNFPVLTEALSGNSTTVSGTLDSEASTQFRVEFFSSPAADPSGHGEGETYLGATNVITDVDGGASFTASVPGTAPVGDAVTATATGVAAGALTDTSEFSQSVVAEPAPPEPPPPPSPPPSAPPATPADTSVALELGGKKKLKAGKPVKVEATCPEEACEVTARATFKVPKAALSADAAAKRKKLKTKKVSESLDAGTTETLKLKPKRNAKRKLKQAARSRSHRKKINVVVKATAVDAAGNSDAGKLKLKLKK